ncbi:RagB/SusD family nutrient uptake outer membrane protein [Paludibacter sp. 221]|uniref:RagB/SusD family nutrient uptake outer membrane protein n=1 Tax=Paludibacter sp. 221 TaxID=2302939 RepID=UPI0013D6DB7E|nr:RagB/SusD family nutrient uptake outer membrane protein [Paludibacter sp. 221]NDV46587.1 RagB/SusD family nutrient uptake outer membrane protein [Paludibacter sp. 221]
MKTRNIILSLFILLLTSCNLDVEVFDQLSGDNVLETESDVKAAVTGIYHELRGGGWDRYSCAWGSLLTMQIGCTDECSSNWLWEPQMDYLWKAETADMGLFYNGLVPAVTRATSLIERMRKVSISAPLKRQYTAEVRCLRAVWAYDLYDLYGTVPLVLDPDIATNPDKAQNYYPERPTVETYVSFVETELKEVQENLKTTDRLTAGDYGRMTVGIAQMYLLKLYMHEAGQERHYRNNEAKAMRWWEKADSVAGVMIADGKYELQKDYMSIWSPTNQRNKEVIFPMPNVPIGGLGNCFLAHALPADYVSLDNIPLTKWGGFLVPWAFYDTYNENDKRLNALLSTYWNGSRMVDRRTEYVGNPGAIPMKYQENPSTTGQWDGSEYVINRYAEVILAKAEALNELHGPTDEAKSYVHQIRSRAFDNYEGSIHEKLVDDITDKDAFRDHILKERGWEFCWEGMRRPDLIRHGKLISNALERGKVSAEPKHILYAIPQAACYENTNIDQNDGF